MKPLMLPLLFALACSSGFAEVQESYRTFHDNQGRSIRAVIVRTSPETVWIRRDDGQTFRVKISLFSKSDQEFISSWEQNETLKSREVIEFSVRRFSDGRETEMKDYEKTMVERFGYLITLKNRTRFDLEDLVVEYRCFARRGELGATGQKRDLERSTGITAIRSIPAYETAEVLTEPISLSTITRRHGSLFRNRDQPNSNQRRIKDDLAGIWIRVRKDGELIAEFATPSTLAKTESW